MINMLEMYVSSEFVNWNENPQNTANTQLSGGSFRVVCVKESGLI